MRPTPVRPLVPPAVAGAVLLAAVLPAPVAGAGDPVPDVDVILEQIPGGSVRLDSPTGGFDEIALDVGKPFAEALDTLRLPPGWTLETKGKTVRLAGPALPAGRPVRLELEGAMRPVELRLRNETPGIGTECPCASADTHYW